MIQLRQPGAPCLVGANVSVLDMATGSVSEAAPEMSLGLAGVSPIHDVRYLDMGIACSLEMLALGDEVIGMTRRFVRGIKVDVGRLARDEIERVGPGGHYLDTDHTYQRFRDELWAPSLLTRQDYTRQKDQGAKDMTAGLREILDTHQVDPLPHDVLTALEEIKERRVQEIAED